MNRTALFIAVLVAALGGFLLYGYFRRFEFEASGGAPVRVLAAKKQLEPGTLLTDEMLTVQVVPQAYVESRAVRETEKARIVGLRMTTPVAAQQTLMWTDLAITADDKRDLSSLVQKGMRAVAVRAQSDDKSFALLKPGDRVDLVGTLPDVGTDQRKSMVLLQNILVLAVGLDTGLEAVGGKSPGENRDLLLHLSLNLPEAQLVALATEKGRLSVALRNPDDIMITEGLNDLNSSVFTEASARKKVQDFRRGPSGPIRLPTATP